MESNVYGRSTDLTLCIQTRCFQMFLSSLNSNTTQSYMITF